MRHARMTRQPGPWDLAMAHGGHGPRGFGWGGGFGMPGPGFGGPGGRRGRGRSRRGNVRAAILLLLEEQPRNGYGLMQEIEERSSGAWRPSPGSVYPALGLLEDEGLIAPAEGDQGKAFALTDAGRSYVEEHREHWGVPWEAAAEGMPAGMRDLRHSIGQLAMAAMQAAQTGNAETIGEVRRILDDARKSIYRLLAGDDEEQ
jgi:DNA-binding PadR family transcriptional regulator